MTSTLLATTAIEELVQSGLSTAPLEIHIDAADADIIGLYGQHGGSRTVTLRSVRSLRKNRGRNRYLDYGDGYGVGYGSGEYGGNRGQRQQVYLPYPPALSVSAVKEYDLYEQASDAEDVDAADYELDLGGNVLRRLDQAWQTFVLVTYTPIDDLAKRRLLLADLVRLSTRYDATMRTAVGPGGAGVGVTHVDYEKERKRLLHRMMPNRPGHTSA